MSTLINVCGPSRSGTTMLDLMLGSGRDAFSCGEIYSWFRPWRPRHIETFPESPEWAHIKTVAECDFHQAVAEDRGADFVIDSSKNKLWVFDTQRWAARHGLRIYNLLLWKDPVDFAYSYWKRGKYDGWYQSFTRYYDFMFAASIDYATVHTNDLVQRPAEKLKELCAYVDMPYFEGKHEFWKHDHAHAFGNPWTRQQVERGDSKIRKTVDYPPDFAPRAEEVRARLRRDAALQAIMQQLRRREVSQLPSQPDGHGYGAPPPLFWLTQYYPRMAKRLYRTARLRWQRWREAETAGSQNKETATAS